MTRAQLIGSSSLLIAIPYFLLAPNWTHAEFVWIGGTVILLIISAIGLSFHIYHSRKWTRRQGITFGIGLLTAYALAFLFLLWRVVAYNMNTI
ncbi:hypothetical protein EVJ29_09650 [Exiguobacterium sp. SH4S7]|uniref:hypothetical protein n=1 Tax=unclassified Exiguobacterium TaxID=2644629 RepID=UPI0008BCC113|nr:MULTISPECIES: hypothetical protein [unclassified Exiguobacterium]OGX80576.1 hypothetical protein A6395_00850 [Exiguobacterium sp. SH31]TCI35711.1 hypothetical protein EVJ29_09650 [Exiguobacterium sp. SH4S7]